MDMDGYKKIATRNATLYQIGFKNGIEVAMAYIERCRKYCETEIDRYMLEDAISDLLYLIKRNFDEEVITSIFLSNSDKDIAYSENGEKDYYTP